MATGHLVAHRQLSLDGDVDLDHLNDAGRKLVALGQLRDLVLVERVDGLELLFELQGDLLNAVLTALAALDLHLRPVAHRNFVEENAVDLLPLGAEDLALVVDQANRCRLAEHHLPHTSVVGLGDDAGLVALVGEQFLFLLLFDLLAALVLLGAFAREDLGADDDALHARRNPQRAVAYVAGLFTEDGSQKLLFRGELGLAFRRDLADQNILRLDLGADAHDARLVEILESVLADVGNVAGDFFLAELGVAGDALELLDVNRGEVIVLDQSLGDQDRIFEVVTAPGHEGDQDIFAKGQLAPLGSGTVGQNVACLHVIARLDDGTLVDAGVLVRALELDQVIDVGLG